MDTTPDTISLSDLYQQRSDILARLAHGPIVFNHDGEDVAVLVSVTQWNALLEELEELQDSLDVMRSQARRHDGEERRRSHDDVWAELDELERRGGLPD